MSQVSSIPEISSKLDWLDSFPPSSIRQPTKEQLKRWIRTGPADHGQIRPYEYCAKKIVDKLVETAELMVPFSESAQEKLPKRSRTHSNVLAGTFSARAPP